MRDHSRLSPSAWMASLSRAPLFLLLSAACALVPRPIQGQEEPTITFTLGMQALYTQNFPDEGDSNGSVAARRFRPGARGSYLGYDFRVMAELAGGSAKLLDGYISREFSPYLTVTAGQGKVPFTRQFLTSYTRLQFVGVSIAADRFNENRQPGVWVSGNVGGALSYTAGAFNGEGINTADQNGNLLKVARLVWTPLGAYPLAESSLDFPEEPRLALGGGVLSKTEGEDEDAADLLRFSLEAAFKLQGFGAVGEYFHERAEPDQGETYSTEAWYAQASYALRSGYELALRYSAIQPDVPDAPGVEQTEKGLAFNRYFDGHDVKLQAEYLWLHDQIVDTSDQKLRLQFQVSI